MLAGQQVRMPAYYTGPRQGLTAQTAGLWLVWITLAISSFVFAEPAPYDALMIGVITTLPLLGLTSFSRGVFLHLVPWLVVGACGFVAATRSGVMEISVKHTAITLYLSLSAVVITAFVRKDPERHSSVVVSGWMWASVIAALCGIVGYFDLVPGTQELFTKFSRARGPFKDPNVLGAFLVPALVYFVHAMMSDRTGRAAVMSVLAALIAVGLLVTFSRGAWFNAAVALLVYIYAAFIVCGSNRFRLKLILLVFLGLTVIGLSLAALVQVDAIAELIRQRAALTQEYDVGPQGRFAGQLKALGFIVENPFGIGAQDFGRSYYGEDVHNVYLSMFLNAGWLGGFIYLGLVAVTLLAAFRHSLRDTPTKGLLIVMLASFAGVAAEGLFVDTDHWRHFFVILGLLWGLMLAGTSAPPLQQQFLGDQRTF